MAEGLMAVLRVRPAAQAIKHINTVLTMQSGLILIILITR